MPIGDALVDALRTCVCVSVSVCVSVCVDVYARADACARVHCSTRRHAALVCFANNIQLDGAHVSAVDGVAAGTHSRTV